MSTERTVTTTCPFCLETAPHEIEIEESSGPHYCKADTATGICRREVDYPLDRCWQHKSDKE